MCSVLADQSVEDMRSFLRRTGTHGEYIRENITGVNAWTEKLKSEFSISHDQRPLELALRMCTIEPQKRPMAQEVLSIILDFDGPMRYYGLCCDEQSDFKDHLSNQMIHNDRSHDTDGLAVESSRSDESQEAYSALFPEAKYQVPTVEDPTEDTTVQAFIPPGGIAKSHILEDAEYPGKAKYQVPTVEDPIEDPTENTTVQAFIPTEEIARSHILENAKYPGEAKYQIPTVEDQTEDTTVQAFIPPKGIARRHILKNAENPRAPLGPYWVLSLLILVACMMVIYIKEVNDMVNDYSELGY